MSGDPAWVIPAISATASLFGTMVGGFSTYMTSKKSFERTQRYQEQGEKNMLLREASIRFIASITEAPLAQTAIQRIMERFGPAAKGLASATLNSPPWQGK